MPEGVFFLLCREFFCRQDWRDMNWKRVRHGLNAQQWRIPDSPAFEMKALWRARLQRIEIIGRRRADYLGQETAQIALYGR